MAPIIAIGPAIARTGPAAVDAGVTAGWSERHVEDRHDPGDGTGARHQPGRERCERPGPDERPAPRRQWLRFRERVLLAGEAQGGGHTFAGEELGLERVHGWIPIGATSLSAASDGKQRRSAGMPAHRAIMRSWPSPTFIRPEVSL
jgi:hypothetical protein